VGRRSLSIGLSIRLSTWAAPADVHSLVDHHGTGIASAQNNRNADTLAAHLHANDVAARIACGHFIVGDPAPV